VKKMERYEKPSLEIIMTDKDDTILTSAIIVPSRPRGVPESNCSHYSWLCLDWDE